MKTLAFDFVVVGGGAAGCVLAARLAQDTEASVALIERGRRDRNPWIHIPATFFKAIQSRDVEAQTSEPDPSLENRPFVVPQGRVLGGGTSVNGMIYMRGQARDYDDWVDAFGCEGWGYADVLPVFKRQERNTRLGGDPYHGATGPLVVDDPSEKHPVTQRIIDAAVDCGVPLSTDFNGAQQDGVGWYQVTAHRGRRQSAATCFLRPALGRENLSLLTGLDVSRLRIEGRRARAVEAFDEAGAPVLITARREIVLTAGSFQSPKLLMLSGIGPRDQLDRHGIEVIEDAPEVGANYQDHVGAPLTARMNDNLGLHGADQGLTALGHGLNYLLRGRGLLTTNLLQGGACVDTSGSGRPDVQYNIAPFAPGRPGMPPLDFHALQIHPMTMRPKSRGRLGLRSSDPGDSLRFHADALGHPEDLDTLRRGVRLAREILNQAGLRELVAEEVWPGPGVSVAAGSNNLDDAIRAQARTIYHPSGTCRMGGDSAAVLDPQLRVRGIEGLRVADCSVMPALVSGNTGAPTMMIADRCADFMLADAI